jgi:hypothetical protein
MRGVVDARGQLVQPVQAGRAGGELGGMDVAVHPERGLVGVGTGDAVGDDGQPDVPALVALADGPHLHQPGQGLGVGVKQAGQFLVAIETVESWLGQVGRHCAGAAAVGRAIVPSPGRAATPH